MGVGLLLLRDVECTGYYVNDRRLLLRNGAVLKDKLQQLEKDDHPLFNEETLLYLPANVGDLEGDKGILI